MNAKTVRRVLVAVISAALVMSSTGISAANTMPSSNAIEVSIDDSATAREIAAPILSDLPGGASADLSSASVIRPQGSELLLVAVEVTGVGFDRGSHAGVAVNLETGEIAQSVQLKVTLLSERSSTIVQWIDGQEVNTQTVTLPASVRTLDGIPQDRGTAAKAAGNDAFQCLAALGIAPIVIWSIIAGCSIFCAATVGAGCIACVAGFTAIGGVSVGICLSK